MKSITDVLTKLLSLFIQKFSPRTIERISEIPLTPMDAMQTLYSDWGANWSQINILGIRNDKNPGIWNDFIFLQTDDELYKFEATVDPSRHWTEKPMNRLGVAHLCLGFHPNIWTIGKHRGKYNALVQRGAKVKIWRDKNKNYKKDDNIVQSGYFGINLHHGYSAKGKVGVHSAGCQVIRNKISFNRFMGIVTGSGQPDFSYLLIPIGDCPKSLLKLSTYKQGGEQHVA